MQRLPLCLNSFQEQCGKNDQLSKSSIIKLVVCYHHVQISSCIEANLDVFHDYCFSKVMPVSHVMEAFLKIFLTHSAFGSEPPV